MNLRRNENGVWTKQITIPYPVIAYHIYPDGREEQVKYGQYEAIEIVTENGWPVERTKQLHACQHFVTHVEKPDGTIVAFVNYFYHIEMSGYGREYATVQTSPYIEQEIEVQRKKLSC